MIPKLLPTLAAAAALYAQGPGPGARNRGDFQPRTGEIKSYLNLTDEQLQALKQLQQERRQAIQPLVREMSQKHQALRDLMQKGGADPAAVGRAVLDLQDLRKRIGDTGDQFSTRAQNVLNADQRAKLKTLDDAAKLRPAIMEAAMLQLLERPAGGPGPAFGPGPGFGFQRGFGGRMHGHPGPPPVQ